MHLYFSRVDDEFGSCKSKVTSLESQVRDMQFTCEEKSQKLEQLTFEKGELKKKLDEKIETGTTANIFISPSLCLFC